MNIWLLQTDSRPTGRAKVHHNEPIVCYDVNRVFQFIFKLKSIKIQVGSMLVTGSTDLSLKVWQLDSGGLLIQVLVGHESVPSCCSISEDGHIVASGGRDKNLIGKPYLFKHDFGKYC
jgi:WD40 repeat protein